MSIDLIGLAASDDEPWGWLAYGHYSNDEFLAAIEKVEQEDWGEISDKGEVERGWGRWVRPEGAETFERIWMGDGWPIPFLNVRYTMVLLK